MVYQQELERINFLDAFASENLLKASRGPEKRHGRLTWLCAYRIGIRRGVSGSSTGSPNSMIFYDKQPSAIVKQRKSILYWNEMCRPYILAISEGPSLFIY
jgi:hypothetical protein